MKTIIRKVALISLLALLFMYASYAGYELTEEDILDLGGEDVYATYTTVSGYTRADAISYSNRHALERSDMFPDYGDNDCTNYVSQCLLAGGLETDNVWNVPGTVGLLSNAWTVADDLKEYFEDYDIATKLSTWSKYGSTSPKSWAYIDDSSNMTASNTGKTVVFYDWDGNGTINHAAFYIRNNDTTYDTTVDGNVTGDLINQHSTDRSHVIWHGDKRNSKRATTIITAYELNT